MVTDPPPLNSEEEASVEVPAAPRRVQSDDDSVDVDRGHRSHTDDRAASDGSQPARRRFLKIATCSLGGCVGASMLLPAAKFLLYPMTRQTVTVASEPIDAVALNALGLEPIRVPLVARSIRDAWSATVNVALGAAWVRRDEQGQVHAVSSVCPHLGCAIGFDRGAGEFRCPCHDSSFARSGDRIRGPAQRGLDPLIAAVDGDRVMITWQRFRLGGGEREPIE